ncbi:hypothetical protein GOP47_0020978, partial [Adiantum capillus-veneris]
HRCRAHTLHQGYEPHVLPIEYTSTIMDIFYHGDLLGQAKVEEGSQGANSQEVLEVPAKLDGLEMTNHLKKLLSDVRKREMILHSVVTIKGNARLWSWTHQFEVFVSSNIKVDPIFLDVLEQENNVHMELAPVSRPQTSPYLKALVSWSSGFFSCTKALGSIR